MTNNKTVLLCGATGFIGRNILENLLNKPGYNVRAVYHKKPPIKEYNAQWVYADLNNCDDVDRVVSGADIILQFAATTSGAGDIVGKPYIHVTDNAVMNSLLLRAAFEHDVEHFIFPSCTVMYQPSNTPIQETDYVASADILKKYYGVGNTKVYIEKMCKFYSSLGRTKHTVLRHSNIYGPYDKYDLKRSHVFGATITKVLNSKDGKVCVWGSGEEERDLLHVNDLVDFVFLAVEKQKNEYGLYNVGLGEPISIKDLVTKIIDLSGRELVIEHDMTRPTIKTSVHLNCEKALKDFGWRPRIDLENGIALTLDWYRENIK